MNSKKKKKRLLLTYLTVVQLLFYMQRQHQWGIKSITKPQIQAIVLPIAYSQWRKVQTGQQECLQKSAILCDLCCWVQCKVDPLKSFFFFFYFLSRPLPADVSGWTRTGFQSTAGAARLPQMAFLTVHALSISSMGTFLDPFKDTGTALTTTVCLHVRYCVCVCRCVCVSRCAGTR